MVTPPEKNKINGRRRLPRETQRNKVTASLIQGVPSEEIDTSRHIRDIIYNNRMDMPLVPS